MTTDPITERLDAWESLPPLTLTETKQAIAALRGVLKDHDSGTVRIGAVECDNYCQTCKTPAPCYTRRAIASALDVTL